MMIIMNDQMIFVFLSVRNTSIVLSFADEQRRGCAGGGQRDSHVQVMISQIFPTTCLWRGICLVGSSNLLPSMSAIGSSGLVRISSTIASDKRNTTREI